MYWACTSFRNDQKYIDEMELEEIEEQEEEIIKFEKTTKKNKKNKKKNKNSRDEENTPSTSGQSNDKIPGEKKFRADPISEANSFEEYSPRQV